MSRISSPPRDDPEDPDVDEVGAERRPPLSRRRPDARAASEPLEALDREDEDGRPADLDLERVGHEELARLHDRRHRVDDLGPGRAVLADDPEDLVDLVVLDADDDRRVRLLEEAARRVSRVARCSRSSRASTSVPASSLWTIATTSFIGRSIGAPDSRTGPSAGRRMQRLSAGPPEDRRTDGSARRHRSPGAPPRSPRATTSTRASGGCSSWRPRRSGRRSRRSPSRTPTGPSSRSP